MILLTYQRCDYILKAFIKKKLFSSILFNVYLIFKHAKLNFKYI